MTSPTALDSDSFDSSGPSEPIIDLAFHGSLENIGTTAAVIEAHGGGGFFVSEAQHDPFVSLAAAAGATSEIALGTSVAIAFARTPMSLAYAAHDVHRLSGGRLILGLGTQVAAHVVRRYGMPWSRPAARMGEYIAALRAIWESWETGGRLSFSGDFYTHTLMSPVFSPGPLAMPAPRIWLAAVGPRMTEVAGSLADGLVLHPLTSVDYRNKLVLPRAHGAWSAAGRTGSLELSAMAMVACGRTEEELASAIGITRTQIAFYASTPAYAEVLEHHGWMDLQTEASECVARGAFHELGSLVDDDILNTFAIIGSPEEVAAELPQRYAGVDRVTVTMPFQEIGEGSAALEMLTQSHSGQ